MTNLTKKTYLSITRLGLNNMLDKIRVAYNSTLAIGGVSSPLDSFVVAESSVLRTNFCAEKPAHRQSAKRCATLCQN